MRCRECNVDLPENYTICPLCNSKTYDDAPLIEGVRTAEYPKVKIKKHKRNPFPFFLALWISCALLSIVLFRIGVIDKWILATGICLLPCIWTLIVRPITVKQLYSGNFVVMNFYSFALVCAFVSYIEEGSLQICFKSYLPVCFILVMTALIAVIFVDFKNCKRASSYAVLGILLSMIMLAVCFIKYHIFAYLWLVAIGINAVILIFLLCIKNYETIEELKAKFSIQ